MEQNLYNVRNLTVSKDKNFSFLNSKLDENCFLFNLKILRILDSGNYYIYTFEVTTEEQRNLIKDIQDNWI